MKLIYNKEKVSLNSNLKNSFLIPPKFKKLPFERIKNSILGSKYELSIVLIGKKLSKSLNNKYRKKNKTTDILSFDLSPSAGEIFICPIVAKTKSKKSDMNFENYLLFLVIHGSLHLKGLSHGVKMETNELTYYSRYRRRYL